ncbi:Chromatin structure-remodeling complex subunit RSC2 [Verticillium dahliae VDG1]|nr:Chromatin structure-remodeling complex subunit RSC2 [Verticillium dahliae VDG1]
MTTRYRVEYALKTHRRDQFIEWIKGLLAVPFVLYSQPTGVLDANGTSLARTAEEAHRRYAEIMRDVELMIDDHITLQPNKVPSKLTMLVPGVGPFFTRLPLEAAFNHQDRKRYISSRRYVSPSFNDVRLVLNTAQTMAVTSGSLQLATFDGDVTLYDDGQCLEPSSPLVPRLLDLLRRDVKIGIVTAAGYTTADRYHERLYGLLDAVAASASLSEEQKRNVVIMGGEANYLFELDPTVPHLLAPVSRDRWLTPEMATWSDAGIAALLDSWGVTVCQNWFASRGGAGAAAGEPIRGENTLHVGDQFLSAGSNDFKARSVGTTAWIASPAETVELLDELAGMMDGKA